MNAADIVSFAVDDAGIELRNPATYVHFYFLVDGREKQVCLPPEKTTMPAALAEFTSALGVPVAEDDLSNLHPSGRIIVTRPDQ